MLMLTRLYRLMCDGCGTLTAPYPSTEEARAGARKAYRWVRRAKRGSKKLSDLCPKCAVRL